MGLFRKSLDLMKNMPRTSTNIKEYGVINYKIHGYILHASNIFKKFTCI
jgi:hypothetical protein